MTGTRRPVVLANCLAAVAEEVGCAPTVSPPWPHPMSAMVESGVGRSSAEWTYSRRAQRSTCVDGARRRRRARRWRGTDSRSGEPVVRESRTVTNRDVLFVFRTPVGEVGFDPVLDHGVVRSTP
jgi:hypothetical protein